MAFKASESFVPPERACKVALPNTPYAQPSECKVHVLLKSEKRSIVSAVDWFTHKSADKAMDHFLELVASRQISTEWLLSMRDYRAIIAKTQGMVRASIFCFVEQDHISDEMNMTIEERITPEERKRLLNIIDEALLLAPGDREVGGVPGEKDG